MIMYIKDHECSSHNLPNPIFLSPRLSKILGIVAFTLLIDCSESYTYLHPGPTTLPHCATSRKVAGSIPDDVIGIFH